MHAHWLYFVSRVLTLVLVTGIGRSQNFNFEKGREQIISLDGLWRFHTGDDPRWADPNFDDRNWPLLRSDRNWARQAYKGYGGFAWYRFRVQELKDGPQALLVNNLVGSYQIFADGRQICSSGRMPPHPRVYTVVPSICTIAEHRSSPDLTIAIRVWQDQAWYRGGGPFTGGHLLGSRELIAARKEALLESFVRSLDSELILCVLEGIAGLTALGFFFAISRSEYEFIWFACMQLLFAARHVVITFGRFHFVSLYSYAQVSVICDAGADFFTVLFYSRILSMRFDWLGWIVVSTLASVAIQPLLISTGLTNQVFRVALTISWALVLVVWSLRALVHGTRRKVPYANWLVLPILLETVKDSGVTVVQLFRVLERPIPSYLLPFGSGVSFTVADVKFGDVEELLFLLSVLAILLGRFTRTRRAEERYARELEEARTVQQVLVPEESPAVPGFSIASTYQPAQQVGGDFFQIIPLTLGVLVAIGDVSGKGLPAAMTVSLIVGTLRTLAEQSESPAAILQGINRRLVGRSAGFTTCLIACLRPDGNGVLANAGHLQPYQNGQEIDTFSGVPLGLSLDSSYRESPLVLHPNDSLTFVSDGVVEAKNAEGELFGFDRTRENSTQPAIEIAKTAVQFGQQDDITVLTVGYFPVIVAY